MTETSPSPIQVMVLHYEDEPEVVSWIPAALYDHYCAEDPSLLDDDDALREADDDLSADLTLERYGQKIRIGYRILEKTENFTMEVEKLDGAPALIILDLFRQTENGMEPVGINVLQGIKDRPTHQIFFLTAYPQDLPDVVVQEIKSDNIFHKPVNIVSFVARIANSIDFIVSCVKI
ncbi:MAG: hypothetical protein H7841_03450 [Magnetospirillum sp. WYHS-4]